MSIGGTTFTGIFKELGENKSALSELSKDYGLLSPEILNQPLDGFGTLYAEGMGRLPRRGGEWEGEPGNSKWKPDREMVPLDKSYSNEHGKTNGELLDKYKIDGIHFRNGEPDFSEISRGTIEIDDFSAKRYGAGGNFDQADTKIADRHGCTKEEVQQWRRDNNYTWHERTDCRTMDKVPREIHGNIPHSGGISVIKQMN